MHGAHVILNDHVGRIQRGDDEIDAAAGGHRTGGGDNGEVRRESPLADDCHEAVAETLVGLAEHSCCRSAGDRERGAGRVGVARDIQLARAVDGDCVARVVAAAAR